MEKIFYCDGKWSKKFWPTINASKWKEITLNTILLYAKMNALRSHEVMKPLSKNFSNKSIKAFYVIDWAKLNQTFNGFPGLNKKKTNFHQTQENFWKFQSFLNCAPVVLVNANLINKPLTQRLIIFQQHWIEQRTILVLLHTCYE